MINTGNKSGISAHHVLFSIYYMASITSGEMADCDWLRSTFSGPLFSRNGPGVHCVKTNACILEQNNKTIN
jgi:hypothetical protein